MQMRSASLVPAALAASIAALVLAGPASAAGPVQGLLGTVEKAAAPAVQAVPAVQQVAPSPAAAQQAGDAGQVTAAVEQTVDRATSPSGSAGGGEQPGASAHHGQESSAGAPADRPESAAHRDGSSHAPSAASSRDASSASSPGSASSTASAPSSGPTGRLLTHGAAPATKLATADARRSPVRHAAGSGTRGLLSAQASHTVAGALARTVRQLTLAPAVLGEASRAIGSVGETAARLAGSTEPALAPLLTALQSPLALSSLPAFPALPALPVLPLLPSFTLVPQGLPLRAQPTGLWPQIAPTSASAGGLERSGAAPLQGAATVSAAFASGVGGPAVAPMTSAGGQAAAPQGRSATGAAHAAARAAAETTPTAASVAPTTGYPDARATAPGGTAPLAALPARSPAPSPGGVSAATSAVSGTSIPVFLTLAGLILLAAPRVRRVLRLLGESWRLSPLALIPERPG
jgi:hypothetical protein